MLTFYVSTSVFQLHPNLGDGEVSSEPYVQTGLLGFLGPVNIEFQYLCTSLNITHRCKLLLVMTLYLFRRF